MPSPLSTLKAIGTGIKKGAKRVGNAPEAAFRYVVVDPAQRDVSRVRKAVGRADRAVFGGEGLRSNLKKLRRELRK